MSDLSSQPSSNPVPSDPNLLVRMLYDEQTRLRDEVDKLRESKDGQKQNDGKDQKEEGSGKQDQNQPARPPLKERVRAWSRRHPAQAILAVAGTLLLVIACLLIWQYIESYENTDDAFVDGHTDPISPRISGFVTAVYVEDTYRVKKGQLLLELDPRDYVVARDQAAASLAQAQAGVRAQTPNVPITATNQSTMVTDAQLSVESSAANLVAAQARYRSAVADLRQAEANQANARREEERYKLLVVKEEVSREMYDREATEAKSSDELTASRREASDAAHKAVVQAEAELHQAQQQLNQSQHNMPRQIAIQHETLAMRNAELKTAQARAEQADLNFQYTRIYAPADGVIGDRSVQVGMQVQPGQEMLAVTESNDLWVTANFKETQIRRMRPGQAVTIHVDALSQDFDGYVEALPGASGAVYSLLPPQNATGNYVKVVQRLPVRILFRPNQRGAERLAPGMSVEPKVWLK